MTRKATNTNVEKLKADVEAAKTDATSQDPNSMADFLGKLSSENEKLRDEMEQLKADLGVRIEKGGEQLKSEISKNPIQSVASAFALGFVVSLILRR